MKENISNGCPHSKTNNALNLVLSAKDSLKIHIIKNGRIGSLSIYVCEFELNQPHPMYEAELELELQFQKDFNEM